MGSRTGKPTYGEFPHFTLSTHSPSWVIKRLISGGYYFTACPLPGREWEISVRAEDKQVLLGLEHEIRLLNEKAAYVGIRGDL